MKTKRIHAVKRRRKWFVKVSILLLLFCGGLFFARQKKDMLVREASDFLQKLLSRETQLTIHIGRISGRVSGAIRFEDVRLEDPALPVGLRLIFRAKSVEVRYRLVDFLTKNFGSKVRVMIRGPELHLRPSMFMRRRRFPFMAWMRDWALAKRNQLSVSVEDLKVVYGAEGHEVSGILFEFENDAFRFELPLRHLDLLGRDVSTQLNVRGKFETGLLQAPDSLTGELSTEGTVINWTPLPWESKFDFTLTNQALEIRSPQFLGGIEVAGLVDFQKDNEADVTVNAKQYPLANFEAFFKTPAKGALEGHLDLEAHLQGPWDALKLEAYARINGGRTGTNHFQALDLHVSGVYPTLQLSDSRILMEDGSAMRFADKTVEFRELFSNELYRSLVSGEEQDTVVMGDWKFKRPTDENERPEFMMQRSFGKHASMHVTKYGETSEEILDSPDKRNTEVGFEYRLKGKDSLKFEMREDEKFVGVERKMSF